MARLGQIRHFIPLAVLLVALGGGAPAAAQDAPAVTPLPRVAGPIPATAESYPLMASATLQTVVDLPRRGYVEEEFFVSGRANVYDWGADGRVVVSTPDAPYTTRILLRRPSDPRRFSGTVILEIGNVGRGYDFSFTWGLSHDGFIENGDAWVAITYAPENIAALQRFDAARYAPLSMASPAPAEPCAGGGAAAPATEEGLRWDAISQVGALLRAARPGGPMAGFDVQRVYATSHGGELATYIAAIHPRARLAGGRPVYDGYVQHRHPGLTRLRRCGAAPAADDPRQILRNVDVPVIRIVAQTDVPGTHARRRDDSDAPGDRYRLYEIAGAAHADGAFYPYIPSVADQKKTGFDAFLAVWPFPYQCEAGMSLLQVPIMTYALNAAFANLTRWVRDGVPAPRAARVALENGGTPQARVVLDASGNAVGGVRTPYLDVPVATYLTSTPGEGTCRNLGRMEPFDWARLNALYGTPQAYAARLAESVDRLVRERWLLESDGRNITAACRGAAGVGTPLMPAQHALLRGLAIAVLIAVPAGVASAQALPDGHGSRTYRAIRVAAPPVVDGDLSDPVWQEAAAITELVQQVPEPGAQPTEPTDVRLVYDDEALYVAFHAYESDPSERTRTMLRYRWDSIWQLDDVVRFAIDTFHYHRRGYAFSFNAYGTKQDAQLDNGAWLSNWDEVWDVRTRQLDDGWTAEVRIPFRILRFPVGQREQVWGLQIERRIQHSNESIQWVQEPPTFSLSRLEYAGHLEGISGIRSERNAQVVPYVAAGVDRARAGRADGTADIGADAKLALGPSMVLDLTYNTNFAQVEVDDQQVNLTRFPLFFPEKREFFLESAQLFNVGLGQDLQMFFSRRIGLAGGEPVPLLGGARLTGKAGPFDVGVLTTQTESEPGSPSSNLSAGRVRWNVGSRSYLGGIVTSAASSETTSQTIAADGRVWLGRYLQLDGFLGVLNDEAVGGRPLSFSTALVYEQDLWGLTLRSFRVDGDFNPALGFVRRRDLHRNEATLRRGWRLNRTWARKVDVSGEISYLSNLEGRLDTRERTFWVRDELASGDIVRFTLGGSLDRLDPLDDPFVIAPRQGIVIPPASYAFNHWTMAYEGFQGRAFRADVEVQGGEFYGGDRRSLSVSGTWRPSPHLVLSGDYQLNDVELPQGAFVTHLQRARISVPITARAVADAFVQWNGLTRELNTQVRLHLIYGRDSNFYVVYTDHQMDETGRLVQQSRALQTKLAYRRDW